MTEQKTDSLEAVETTVEKALMLNDTAMVNLSITLPKFKSGAPKASLKRINDFYEYLAAQKLKYAQSILFKQAVKTYGASRESSFPFNAYVYTITSRIQYNQDQKLSVTYDVYEHTGGAHGNTICYSDNWSTLNGYPIEHLFPSKARQKIIANAIAQAIRRQADGEAQYFENLPKNMNKYFKNDQCYLTPEGLMIFYQLYTIAPYVAGIQTFSAGVY